MMDEVDTVTETNHHPTEPEDEYAHKDSKYDEIDRKMMEEEGEENDEHNNKQHTNYGDNGHGANTHNNNNAGGHHGAAEKYDGNMEFLPLYRMIYQRQRWGDEQKRLHTDFSDTFFDLFYVAGAYNLGNIIREEPGTLGLLYFVGCFLPLQELWSYKLYFDARYYFSIPDLYHDLHEKAGLVALATTILNIRPVAILSHPTEYVDMFVFSISLSFAYLMSIARLLEVMLSSKACTAKSCEEARSDYAASNAHNEKGSRTALYPEAFHAAFRDLILQLVPCLFFIVATVYSGVQFYGNGSSSSSSNVDTSSSNEVVSDHSSNSTIIVDTTTTTTTTSTSDVHHRDLAGGTTTASEYPVDNVAIWLVIAGALSNIVLGWYVYLHRLPKNPNKHEHAVPLNIDYVIHRHGEWVMLMLGESILSLLIVNTYEAFDYFSTFVCGILSIVFLQYLHFQTQPHDPDDHAMRKHIINGVFYVNLLQIYSGCLVILGVSYKMFLYEISYEGSHVVDDATTSDAGHRVLSGSFVVPLQYTTEDRRQRVAYFFSGSLALVLLCLDGMTFLHQGMDRRKERCKESIRLQILGYSLKISRLALLAFVLTVHLYVTAPDTLAVIGLCCILTHVILCTIDAKFFFPRPDNSSIHPEHHDLSLSVYAPRQE